MCAIPVIVRDVY